MKERWQRHYMKGEKVDGGQGGNPSDQAEAQNAEAYAEALAGAGRELGSRRFRPDGRGAPCIRPGFRLIDRPPEALGPFYPASGRSSGVEHDLAKVGVGRSNRLARSKNSLKTDG
jgi:hypothetical protein